MRNTNPRFVSEQLLNAEEPKFVKIVVFDDKNRVLTVKSGNRFVLPGGRIEWDDDDAEAAARREVFEAANIALNLVKAVEVIKIKNQENKIAQTLVFVSRMHGEASTAGDNQRFMDKETFFETHGGQSDLVRSLVEVSHRVLVSEEIKDEQAETAQFGHEKYNFCSLL